MSLKQLRRDRGYTKAKLTRVETFVKNVEDEIFQTCKEELVLRLEKLEAVYKEFRDIQEAIFKLSDEDDDLTADNNMDMEFEESYVEYLSTSVSGNAAQVIEAIQVSDKNYEIAWKLLQERYDDQKSIKKKHIQCLFEIPKIQKESADSLRELIDYTKKHIRILESMDLPVASCDALLVHMIESKLDNVTRRSWEQHCESEPATDQTFDNIIEFLQKRCKMLKRLFPGTQEKVSKSDNSINPGRSQGVRPSNRSNENRTTVAFAQRGKCYLCQGDHYLYCCEQFLSLPIENRMSEVKRLRICINCFRDNHFVKDCRAGPCRHCQKKHNSLCHIPKDHEQSESHELKETRGKELAVQSSQECSKSNLTVCHSQDTRNKSKYNLMATAIVYAKYVNGSYHAIRVLLDSASEANFVSYAACNKLGILKRESVDNPILGINDSSSHVNQACSIVIASQHSDFKTNIYCFATPKVTNDLPSVQIDVTDWHIPETIKLADPHFDKRSQIDMIICAEYFLDLLETGKIKLGEDLPVLHNTCLGWIVSGAINRSGSIVSAACHVGTNVLFTLLDHKDEFKSELQRFWEIEDYKDTKNDSLSILEKKCEDYYSETTTRDSTGHFVVRLPLRQDKSVLGQSRDIALKHLQYLENRFEKNVALKEKYCEFMQEYLDLGHMSPVESNNVDPKDAMVYLPHHGVLREASSTTKLRVVFNGSLKTSSGLSLNDIQLVGPTLQDNLIDIILRFRLHKIAITTDIIKMYRQVLVHPEDRKLQRILFRFSKKEPVQEFELNTVTYGQACAPYLAIKSLRQLATVEREKYPEAASIVFRDSHVDDFLTGANTEVEAKELIRQLIGLMNLGGFELHKFSSNSRDVLESIPVNQRETKVQFDIDTHETIKTLGLQWQPTTDNFHFSACEVKSTSTKRAILSVIARLYDPLGLLGPVIISAKMIMQETWKLDLNWDDSVPDNLKSRWLDYLADLGNIKLIRIPRIVICDNAVQVNLHGFCDASTKAYGACVCIQSFDNLGHSLTALLCSKSKVAPVKKISLPRMELCGALTLARLMKHVEKALGLQFKNTYAWTDSMIALAWIRGDAARWKPFVSNRVLEIQKLVPVQNWQHVKGEENPADLVSRGASVSNLQDNKLWWNGPNYMKEELSQITSRNEFEDSTDVETEIHKEERGSIKAHVLSEPPEDILLKIIEDKSSLTKMQRTLAYCLRFINNCKMKIAERNTSALTTAELQRSLDLLVKSTQKMYFNDDIKHLESKKELKSNSKLSTLSPFLDETGLLRVGGRLSRTDWSFSRKHPILLPAKSKLTLLIFEQEHLRYLHAGPQALLSAVRLRFWPLNGRNLARQVVHKCIRCFRNKPPRMNQLMGQLPQERVQPSRPFFVTGVDYGGPIITLVNKGRGRKTEKSYIALFICFATKAIHLEAVSALTSEAFIAALRRFAARRGPPQKLYSDNATNFTGADRELRELYEFLRKEKDFLNDVLIQEGIQWNFIPPGSPHMGGLWEAGIKSCKNHLKRVMGSTLLTFEEFGTLLTQIEGCLNSRPICQLSSNPNDLEALTPGHFLIGEPIKSIPDVNLIDVKTNRLNRWQLCQSMVQNFWNRWSREYVSSMQPKSKWRKIEKGLEINDLVIIQDENISPTKWKLGKITETHPGKDGVTRVVTIKTQNGQIKRSIAKLCKLPTNSD